MGKPIVFKPRTNICQISEVDIVEDLSSKQNFQHEKSCENESKVKIDRSNLSENQLEKVQELLHNFDHIFSKGPTDIGCTNLLKHKIVLEDETPFKQPYRRIPPGLYDEVRQHIKEMLEADVIRESESPFSSNIVLVRKKDGSLRFCIDWRQLNAKTKKDAYKLPRFDDIVDSLTGAVYFSKLDLRAGYWNVELEESSKQYTAFNCGNLGFYEMNRLGFGLCNSPATFQRLMERCMGDKHLKECLIFLDDILVYSKTFEEHIERLHAVFSKLAEHKLKLKPSKCELFKSSVTYLGHIISSQGICTDPDKTNTVSNWPAPTNVKELREFLGFAGFYRRYIQHFSQIVEPLTYLLKGQYSTQRKQER